MKDTLDVYKYFLGDDESWFDFFTLYNKNIFGLISANEESEKNLFLKKVIDQFAGKSEDFKAEFLNYAYKLSEMHSIFEKYCKEYDLEMNRLYVKKFFSGLYGEGDPSGKSAEEIYEEDVANLKKPEDYDVYKSLIEFIRARRLCYLISFKECFPESINQEIFEKTFRVLLNCTSDSFFELDKHILAFFEKNRGLENNISGSDGYLFSKRFKDIEIKNKVSRYIFGKFDYSITLTEPIGEFIFDSISKKDNKTDWINLVNFFQSEGLKTQPSKKWINTLPDYVNKVGFEDFKNFTTSTLEIFFQRLVLFQKERKQEYLLEFTNQAIIRGLFFSTGYLNEPGVSKLVFQCVELCLKKVKDVGALLVKVGNAGIYGFSYLPYENGKHYLSLCKATVKYPQVSVKCVENSIIHAAKLAGKSPEELEDAGMPTFGFSSDHTYEAEIGDYKICAVEKKGLKIDTFWRDNQGKPRKSVPEELKKEFPAEVKEETKLLKEAQNALTNYKNRIESFYLQKRTWKHEDWQSYFLENGFIGIITKKLLWYFEKDDNKSVALFLNNRWIDNNENEVTWIDNNTKVELWHPLGFDPEFISDWKLLLEKWQISQPFKQVYREIYLITEAELVTQTYSNRFASHILNNYQFGALLKEKNWVDYNQFHKGGLPRIKVKKWKIEATYDVEFIHDAPRWGDLITSSQVTFYDKNGAMELSDVPAIVFSEVMRDIDLFVSVCSVGNDPNWIDGGHRLTNDYNAYYSFGDLLESALVRKTVLENLIPKLKISKVADIIGNFLVIKGKIRTYKIHMGSGNILMEPNNQYLCIVPKNNPNLEKVFLPFDGDYMLSIILSKAFLLADDDKITDTQILSQIHTSS